MKKIPFSHIGIMSVGYQLYSLDYTLKSIADAGFKCIDFWGGAPHYCYYDTPQEKRQEKIKEIRDKFDKYGLKCTVFTAEQICLYPINVASSNEYVRRKSIDIVKGYIEDTKALGAEYFFPQMGYCMFDENDEEALKRSVEALKEMADYAEKLGVKMVMEQLQKYESNLCYDTKTLKYLIDATNSPNLKVCVDCIAAATGNESVESYYDTFGSIGHIHVADGNPEGHVVPGDGENPVSEYLKTLAMHDYDGYVTMEINNQRYFSNPHDAAKRTVEWLKNCEWVDADK